MSWLEEILQPLPFEEVRVSLPDGAGYITTIADDARYQIITKLEELIEQSKEKSMPLTWLAGEIKKL